MKYFFTYIFLLSLFTGIKLSAFSQDSKELEAILLFEQAQFASNDSSKVSLVLTRVNLLNELKRHQNAIQELKELSSFNVGDSLLVEIEYAKALTYFLLEDQPSTYLAILKIKNQQPLFYQKSEKVLKLELLHYADQKKWELFEKAIQQPYFEQLFDNKEINGWYNSFLNLKFKKENTALWLSSFVPGSGHVYAGRVGEGLTSFILNAAALGFMGYNFWLTNYFTTFTSGSALLQQFYFGSSRRAVNLIKDQNEALKARELQKLLKLMP